MTLSRLSIPARALLLIAVVAIPYSAFQIYAGLRSYTFTVSQAEDRVIGVASATAVAVEQLISVAERSTRSLARTRGPELLGPACLDYIRPLGDAFPFFANVLVVDSTGRMVCSAHGSPGDSTVSAAERDWFRAVRSERGFSVSRPVMGPITQDWVVAMGSPIQSEDGTFLGAVAGTIQLLRLEELLAGRNRRPYELLTITTAEGVVVARSVDAELWVGRPLPSGTVEVSRRSAREFITRTEDASGLARIWGRVDLPEIGWRVYTGVPADRVNAATRTLFRRDALIGLLTLVGAFLLAALLFRGISESMEQLVEGVRASASGGAVPLPPAGSPEVVEVVTHLNRALEARDRAQEAERAARDRVQHILENAVFGICVMTLDGRFLQANHALADMLGYGSPEDLTRIAAGKIYHSGHAPAHLIDRLEAKGRLEDVEVEWVAQEGEVVAVRLNGKMVVTPDGERAVELMVQDISEHRALEELARHQQKMEAVGRLAGGIAHEFNNLLTVLGVNSELISRTLGPDHPLRDEADEVEAALERAGTLTRKLLAFSRKEVTQPRLIDINEVVGGLEGMLRKVLGDAIRLETDLARGPGRVWIDPSHLEQVVLNLVLNARDALGHDGGVIQLRTETVAASLQGDDEGSPDPPRWFTALIVSDDGPGMEAAVERLVFEPFFTTKPTGVGTGLGLPTVYGIVAEAGGRVDLETAPGQGAVFSVLLPVDDAEQDQEDAGEATPGDETILLVSENPSFRALVRDALEAASYHVIEAGSATGGLDAFWRYPGPVDLLICDPGLPDISGHHLLERLRRERAGLPALLVTDRDPAELPGRGVRVQVISPPFGAAALGAAVRRALDPTPPSRRPTPAQG